MKTKLMIGFMAFLILAMPFAFAAQNETNEQKANKEYPAFERALDRIRLVFTMQIERRLELINKIQEKRQQHYQFLLEKGKTKQAEDFNNKTIGIVKNFDQWKANKQDIIQKIGSKKNSSEEIVSAKMPAPGYENVTEMIVEKDNPSGEKSKSN